VLASGVNLIDRWYFFLEHGKGAATSLIARSALTGCLRDVGDISNAGLVRKPHGCEKEPKRSRFNC